VLPTGCITIGMKGDTLAPIGSLKRAGVVAITDDGDCVQSNELMRRAIEYAKMFGLPVMDHCQDQSMTEGAVMNEGDVSIRLGLRGWPNAAEDVIVSRNVILSSYTGAHIHMQHISSALSVDILRRAKADGVRVTAEATPHHIALTDEALATYDTNFKMNPPLRTEADRRAIIAGLKDGTLDCIATDHAPHTDYEKDKEFDYAPNGILGLETALAVVLEVLVRQNKFKLSHAIDLMTRRPARDPRPAGRHAWRPAPPPTSASSTRTRRGPTTPRPARASRATRPWSGRTLSAASRRRSSTAGSSSRSRRRDDSDAITPARARPRRPRSASCLAGLWLIWRFVVSKRGRDSRYLRLPPSGACRRSTSRALSSRSRRSWGRRRSAPRLAPSCAPCTLTATRRPGGRRGHGPRDPARPGSFHLFYGARAAPGPARPAALPSSRAASSPS
jgi:hypothetical protein